MKRGRPEIECWPRVISRPSLYWRDVSIFALNIALEQAQLVHQAGNVYEVMRDTGKIAFSIRE